jgi:bile acid-coenzyme A ligase
MSNVADDGLASYGARLHELAQEHPEEVAVRFASELGDETTMTWSEFDRRSSQVARALAGRGLLEGDMIAIARRNSLEHLVTCFGAWKLGAVPVPVRWDLPEWERHRVLKTIGPRLVIEGSEVDLFSEASTMSDEPLEDRLSPHAWGVCSSGSTGTPKVILTGFPAVHTPGSFNRVPEELGHPLFDQLVLVPAPLYHTNGFASIRNILCGVPIVLLERFDAELILDLIERHQITGFIAATPMLLRISRVPGVEARDLSSIEWIQQGAAPLPIWLGRKICELIGPDRFFMSFGATEGIGLVAIRGDDYLEHPGTLGKGVSGTEIKILDDDGAELPTGEVGLIFLRTPSGPMASYKGEDTGSIRRTEEGFATLGDLGWLDEDGFLYLADRRVDMIVTGGANVYPAEVEAALSEHPEVADVVVIGLSDEEWGHRVHAIVQLGVGPAVDEAALITYAKDRLAPYKVPKSVELVDKVPRSDAMKINRGALVAEREQPA